MTTLEIEALANQDGLATTDFANTLKQVHRRLVIPEFFRDLDRAIGRLHWRRKTTTFSVVVGTRNYDCPTDFDKFELKGSMKDVPPRMVTRILQLDLKAKACTVFQEPSKRLSQGQIKITHNRMFVLFLERGRIVIFSAILNKNGIYVGSLIRGGEEKQIMVLVQALNPARVRQKKNVFSFSDENSQFAMIIETLNESSETSGQPNNMRRLPTHSSTAMN